MPHASPRRPGRAWERFPSGPAAGHAPRAGCGSPTRIPGVLSGRADAGGGGRLNQMSDYWEERIPHALVEAEALRNALGSLVAGVCSGYLSHIPHNLSTLKLMTPSKSYMEHLAALVSQSEGRVPHRRGPVPPPLPSPLPPPNPRRRPRVTAGREAAARARSVARGGGDAVRGSARRESGLGPARRGMAQMRRERFADMLALGAGCVYGQEVYMAPMPLRRTLKR